MAVQIPEFPVIDYTFEIKQTLFEMGTIIVKYTPVDERLTAIEYNIPIWPTMDLNNLKPYVDQWAPYDKWYAQGLILDNPETLSNGGV